MRWSRKKRDTVDELIVRESQEEEADWLDFSQEVSFYLFIFFKVYF
jgi:hypothetical protein